jgi:HK97 family phage major capsid protein
MSFPQSLVTLREQTYAAAAEARAIALDSNTSNDAWNVAAQKFKSLHEQFLEARGEPPDDPDTDIAKLITRYTASPRTAQPAGGAADSGLRPFPSGARPYSSRQIGALSLGAAFIEARQARLGFNATTTLLEPGSTAVPLSLRAEPFNDPRQATFLAQLFGEENAPGGQTSYMRQTVRTLNAAVVAAGAKKPTSNFQYKKEPVTVGTIAHVSDPINRFDIEDAPSLQTWLDAEMRYGLDLALDALVVDAILDGATQGSGTVDLAGIRSAITTLQLADLVPNAIALSPQDWEDVEGEVTSTYVGDSNVVTDALTRRLFSLPIVVSNSLEDGTAIVGQFGPTSGTIFVTGGVRIDVSDSTPRVVDAETVSDFQLNQVVVRAERRATPVIGRPTAFVVVGAAGS